MPSSQNCYGWFLQVQVKIWPLGPTTCCPLPLQHKTTRPLQALHCCLYRACGGGLTLWWHKEFIAALDLDVINLISHLRKTRKAKAKLEHKQCTGRNTNQVPSCPEWALHSRLTATKCMLNTLPCPPSLIPRHPAPPPHSQTQRSGRPATWHRRHTALSVMSPQWHWYDSL